MQVEFCSCSFPWMYTCDLDVKRLKTAEMEDVTQKRKGWAVLVL